MEFIPTRNLLNWDNLARYLAAIKSSIPDEMVLARYERGWYGILPRRK